MTFQLFKIFASKIIKEYTYSPIFKCTTLLLIPLGLVWLNLWIGHATVHSPSVVFDGIDRDAVRDNFPGNFQDKILYYPNTTFTFDLIEKVREDLTIIYERVRPFSSLDALESALLKYPSRNLFVIIFHTLPDGDRQELNYTIRSRNQLLGTDQIYRNNYNELSLRANDDYVVSGILAMQMAINEQFMLMQNMTVSSVVFEHFPTKSFTATTNMDLLYFSILLILMVCLNVISTVLIPMVDEKQSGVRSLLKVTTSYFYLNEIARLVCNFVVSMILIACIFLIATAAYDLWGTVSVVYPLMLTVFFVLALLSYTIAISLCFKSTEYCKIAGILFYLVPFFVFHTLGENQFIAQLKYISPPNIFVDGMDLIRMHLLTMRNINLCSNDIPKGSTDASTPPTLLYFYAVLLGQCITYLIVYLVLKNFESKEALKKTIDKLFRKINGNRVENNTTEEIGLQARDSKNAIVRVKNVGKKFHLWPGKVKEAVKNLSLDVMGNEITILLGHNGAGKTTLISMITGVLACSYGEIWVNGCKEVRKYAKYIGYCPQQNVFIKQFNCLDNVRFFGRLRGISAENIDAECAKVLTAVNLKPYELKHPDKMSGGEKRRLCLAISVIGDTKVVVLDEPTSGLDPKSRRELWDILIKLKRERSVLLTTHYMEEADTLGDHVAIMEEGVIVCTGTPIELKNKYTSGYILKIVTNPDFNEDELSNVMKAKVPAFSIKRRRNESMSYNIPYEDKMRYASLLRVLETNKSELNINSLSISNPPLEEVFVRCRSLPDGDKEDSVDVVDSNVYTALQMQSNERKLDFTHLMRSQIRGVVYKNCIHIKNHYLYFVFLIMLPFAAFFVSQIMIHYSLNGIEQDRLALDYATARPNDSIVVVLNKLASNREQERLKEIFMRKAPTINFEFFENTDIDEILLEKYSENLHWYNEKIIAGIEMNFKSGIPMKVLFSGNYHHSTVKAYNLLSNVLLEWDTGDPDITIESWNKPLLRKTEVVGRSHVFIYENLMALALFCYILFYSMNPFNDNSSQFKSLFCLGACTYWMVSLTFDLFVHAMVVSTLTLTSYFFDFTDLFDGATYVKLGTIFFVYGVAVIPLLYLLTKYIKSQENLYSIMSYLSVTGLVIYQLLSTSDEKIRKYGDVSRVLYLIPDFGVRHAMSLAIFDYFTGLKKESHDHVYDLTWYYFVSVFLGVLLILILVNISENLYISDRLSTIKWHRKTSRPCKDLVDGPSHHSSVPEEEQSAKRLFDNPEQRPPTEYPVVMLNVKKTYDDNCVVEGLCLKVGRGECFGLLGTNGAGKTSTLEMMTLNKTITEGTIYLNRFHSRKNRSDYQKSFGYCPQVDALNLSMTAYETIKYMCLIRGVTDVEAETNKWIDKCDLGHYRSIPVAEFSGGTKRKLNTAIALIGSPPVIFLDEPTTGIDPVSRQKIWKCIKELIGEGRTIILTSHNLDECEHLCNRIGIMYKGRMQCFGVTQKLKNDYGDGYQLIVKLRESLGTDAQEIERIETRMRLDLVWMDKEHHGQILKYRIEEKNIVWSKVFEDLSRIKDEFTDIIDDYWVNEVSLEDIFLHISRGGVMK